MTDSASLGLREIATPQLYRRNAFRLTGLPTDVDRRTARQRRQAITTRLEVGADLDLGHDLELDAQGAARAFDLILGDPRRRLVQELFWFWGTPQAGCGCPQALHRDHDAAVRAHSRALDHEVGPGQQRTGEWLELEELWTTAGTLWAQQVRRKLFWDHVRHRIRVLDDKQLGEDTVELLRSELPAALAQPLIQLTAAAGDDQPRLVRLARLARAWPAPEGVVGDVLEGIADSLFAAIEAGLTSAVQKLNTGPPQPAVNQLDSEVLPKVTQLEQLAPHQGNRRAARTRNDVAVVYNNCATKLIETRGPAADPRARTWLKQAEGLAGDPQTQLTIRQNGTLLTDVVELFRALDQQVDGFVSIGRKDLARSLLRRVRKQLAGGPGVDLIDGKLAALDGRVPAGVPRGRYPLDDRPSRPAARQNFMMDGVNFLLTAVFWAGLLFGIVALVRWLW